MGLFIQSNHLSLLFLYFHFMFCFKYVYLGNKESTKKKKERWKAMPFSSWSVICNLMCKFNTHPNKIQQVVLWLLTKWFWSLSGEAKEPELLNTEGEGSQRLTVPHFQTHCRTSEIKMGVVLAERTDKAFNGQNGETKP